MPSAVIAAEPIIRMSCFFGVLALMALWEAVTPRRRQSIRRLLRWPNNLGLVMLNTLLVRLLFPFAGVGMAFFTQTTGWGLFNIVPVPAWLAIPIAVLLLDLTIYGQHVMFHAVPFLWRLHRMHPATRRREWRARSICRCRPIDRPEMSLGQCRGHTASWCSPVKAASGSDRVRGD